MKAWLARVLAVFALTLGGVVGGAAVAVADCTPDGVPNYAGSGVPGMIDDPVDKPSGETKYGDYGWAGYKWYTCDLGIGPDVGNDPIAVGDTYTGNIGLGTATMLGSAMTQVHDWNADPAKIMAPVDGVVADIADVIRTSTWAEYSPALIILAAVFIIAQAMNGDTRRAVRTIGAVFAAMFVIAWLFTPRAGEPGSVAAAKTFDGVVSQVVGGVDRSILERTGSTEGVSDDEARGASLADKIIYPLWSRGALGSESAMDKFADPLYRSGAVTQSDGEGADAESYRGRYDKVATQIKEENDAWYVTLQGKSYNRAGQGFLATLMMAVIALIRIPAEFLVLVGLLVMRVAVMFAPIFALAGILEATRPYAKAALKMVLASIVNVAIFGIVAAIHTGLVSAIVNNSDNIIKSLFILICLTVLVWMLSKPFRSPTKLATGDDAAAALDGAASAPSSALSRVGGLVGAAAPSMIGSYLGNRKADEDRDPQNTNVTLNSIVFSPERPEMWSRVADGDDELPEYTATPHPRRRNEGVGVDPVWELESGGGYPQLPPAPTSPGQPGGGYPTGPSDGPSAPLPGGFDASGEPLDLESSGSLHRHVRVNDDDIFIPDLVIDPVMDDEDWREPVRVNGTARLIEPEYDQHGNLTYDIFIPEMPESPEMAEARS